MKTPKATPPTPPPPPTNNQAADNAARDSGAGKKRGYQSTILGKKPESNTIQQATKTLLGQ